MRSLWPRDPSTSILQTLTAWLRRLDVLYVPLMLIASGIVVWAVLDARSSPDGRPPEKSSRRQPEQPTAADGRSAAVGRRVSTDGAPSLGNAEAMVAIMAFSDFQCPFCAKFAEQTLPKLKAAYVDTGKVRLAFRHLPLERIHRLARHAAAVTVCAGDSTQFWALHDSMFQLPREAQSAGAYEGLAVRAGIPVERLTECLASPATRRKLDDDISSAAELNLRTTPAFLVGLQSAGVLTITEVISGAQSFAVFERILLRTLQQTSR